MRVLKLAALAAIAVVFAQSAFAQGFFESEEPSISEQLEVRSTYIVELDPSVSLQDVPGKARAIADHRAAHPGATIVHIGNGRVSDTCGALAADLAFAKDSLAVELSRRGAAFEPFETLRDVPPALERLVAVPEVG